MPNELTIRLAAFTSVLLLVGVWEVLSPRRALVDSKRKRWLTNLALVVIDSIAVRVLFPVLPVAFAQYSQSQGWGILNILQLPFALKTVISFIILDFTIYLQHLLFHHIPLLWRLHRMHHTDLDLDVTSGNRFHPLEIVLSIGIKMGAIVLIGAPYQAVLVFEVVLNACAMFSHGNINLPGSLDRLLRLVMVTPDMHRVHHSTIVRETNSNFGFNLPWWDRLCGTYRPQPEKGHLGMTIGLKEYRDADKLTLFRLLIQPFISP